MFLSLRTILVAVVPLHFVLPASAGAQASRITVDGWTAEVHRTVADLVGTHPEPFHKVSREEFDHRLHRFKSRLTELEPHQVVVGLMKLVAGLGDGHTRYDCENGSHGFDRLLPFLTYRFSDGLFVVAATREHRGLVGCRIVKYGRLPVTEAMVRVGETVSGDNPSGVLRGLPYAMQRPAILQAVGVAETLDGLTLVVARPDETRETLTVSGIPREDPSFASDAMVFLNDEPERLHDQGAPLHLHWLKHPRPPAFSAHAVTDIGAMYVRLNRIRDDGAHSFAEFWATVFGDIEKQSLTRLIIDIRHNPGGNNTLLRPLIHGIIRSPNLSRRGHTFVIIGRDTFSAAVNLATRLQRETDLLFVGEPTAGSPNHFGDAEIFYHYQTDLTMIVSKYRWQDSVPWDERPAIDPDLPAPLSSTDFKGNIDPALRAIRGYLSASGK